MPKCIMMVGGSGSGKSYIRKKELPTMPVLDCDMIKMSHPDYDPTQPQLLHEWSREKLKVEFHAMLETGQSFVYDGTGTNVEKYLLWIAACHRQGYEVELFYVACDLQVALQRNRDRKRTVPEHVVREKHSTVAFAFEALSRYVDRVRVIDNS